MSISKKEILTSHHYRFEMLEDIRSAKIEKYQHHLDLVSLKGDIFSQLGLSNRIQTSHLRSAKNHMLSMNSMCCLMAEYGGLDTVLSHYTAEKYAILIEESQSLGQLDTLLSEFLYIYLDPTYRNFINHKLTFQSHVDQYIETNFMNKLTVQDIANHFNFSREYISRKYKQASHITVGEKISEVRIREAQKFLSQTNLSIVEIALLVGYNSSQHFSKVFKNALSMTPSDYRKLNMSQNNTNLS